MKRPTDPDDKHFSKAKSKCGPPPLGGLALPKDKPKAPAPPLPAAGLAQPVYSQGRSIEPVPHAGQPLPVPAAMSGRSECDSDAEDESAMHFARFRQSSLESNQQQQSSSSLLLKAVSKRKAAKTADAHHPKFQQIAGFSQMALSLFWGVLVFMGDCSGLFKQIQCSEFASQHTSRILSGYATNTVLRYLAAWSHFVANLEGLGFGFGNLDSVMMADVLVTMSLEKHGDPTLGSSCCMTIKALRWLCKVAECTILSCAYEKVIDSFLKSKIPRERRESFPLPTWVLQLWERRILMKQASLIEVVVLGGFLVAAWGSLRFADLQRVEWSSLSFDLHVLRGTCYATKTCHTGQPWGILASGILSRGTHSWVSKYLHALDRLVTMHVRNHTDSWLPSFLLPAVQGESFMFPLQAMSYAEALRWMRHFLLMPWASSPPEVPPLNFTVHSLKATMLSMSLQVNVDEVDRKRQGHHRISSSALYSRDDVHGMLRCQTCIRASIRTGFRFLVPQHRGGQQPLTPAYVPPEAFSKDYEFEPFQWFSFQLDGSDDLLQSSNGSWEVAENQVVTPDPDTEALDKGLVYHSDPGSSDESEEEPSAPPAEEHNLGEPDEFLLGSCTAVLHVLCPADALSGTLVNGTYMRAKCGATLPADRLMIHTSVPSSCRLCRRGACLAALSSFSEE